MKESSIVRQLQELALDPNSNLEELLNKCLFISRKLKIKPLRKWCELEIEGYSGQQIPSYRKIKGELKAHNPVRGLIPFVIPPELDEIVTNIDVIQPIGEICSLVNTVDRKLFYTLTSEMNHILMQMQRDYLGSPMMPKLIIDISQLMAIQKKVRNIILDWSMRLEEDGVLGEGLKFSEKEKEKVAAMSVNNFNIQNMQGVAGNISGGTINQNNQMNIQPKDFDSLAKYLMQNSVEFSDIQNLKDAIESDPTPTEPNKLGNKVSSWIGSMIGKAANGSWDISIATAGTVLGDAISKYYGLG